MVNVVLGLSVLVLSSVLAVLYLVREIRVGDTRVEEIEVRVGVLLFLSGGLLGLFNWFVGGLRRVEEEEEEEEKEKEKEKVKETGGLGAS